MTELRVATPFSATGDRTVPIFGNLLTALSSSGARVVCSTALLEALNVRARVRMNVIHLSLIKNKNIRDYK
jgi:hypothetical protein